MMKKLLLTCILPVMSVLYSLSQVPDFSDRCIEEMDKLSYLIGNWKGTATYRTPQGQELQLIQEEHIEWRFRKLIITIDGRGMDLNAEEVLFQSFALLHFDPLAEQFKFKSFVKEGYSVDAYFKIIEENKFEWGFNFPKGGKYRYTIMLDPSENSWTETGEYSMDEENWIQTLELHLVKQN